MESKLEKSNVEYCKFLNANIYNHYPDVLSTEKIIELIKLFPDYELFIPREIILGRPEVLFLQNSGYRSRYDNDRDTIFISDDIYLDNYTFIGQEGLRYPAIAYLIYYNIFLSKDFKKDYAKCKSMLESEDKSKKYHKSIHKNTDKFVIDNKEVINKIFDIDTNYTIDYGIITIA